MRFFSFIFSVQKQNQKLSFQNYAIFQFYIFSSKTELKIIVLKLCLYIINR